MTDKTCITFTTFDPHMPCEAIRLAVDAYLSCGCPRLSTAHKWDLVKHRAARDSVEWVSKCLPVDKKLFQRVAVIADAFNIPKARVVQMSLLHADKSFH